ncbi:MAG: hypothetical protein WC184_05120 [Acidimicrobiia bacterium]
MSKGPLCLVGGDEWSDGCDFDAALLEDANTDTVVVLTTAAAYENPKALVERAEAYFSGLGAKVVAPELYSRRDAMNPSTAEVIAEARFVYLGGGSSGGSPMHVRSVLSDSLALEAIIATWHAGNVLAASAASGSVLFRHMVDTRGGAFTQGLALLDGFTMIPGFDEWSSDKVHRTIDLAPPGMPVVGVERRSALIHRSDAGWSSEGAGAVHVYVGGHTADLNALPPLT